MSNKPPKTSYEGSNVIELRRQLKNPPANIKKADLLSRFEEVSDFCLLQAKQIDELSQKLDQKDLQIRHLEELLKNNTPIIGKSAIKITDEEEIALIQLEKLKEIGTNRPFTVDEARIFDILVKNKRLSQADNPPIDAAAKKVENLDTKQLLAIADKSKK